MHPARSKQAPGGVPAEHLAVIFDDVPFPHIGTRVNASLDGSGNLSVPPLIGIVRDVCFQPAYLAFLDPLDPAHSNKLCETRSFYIARERIEIDSQRAEARLKSHDESAGQDAPARAAPSSGDDGGGRRDRFRRQRFRCRLRCELRRGAFFASGFFSSSGARRLGPTYSSMANNCTPLFASATPMLSNVRRN